MRRNYVLLGVVMAAVVGLAACSSDSPTAPPASPTPAAYSIALTASPTEAEVNTAITVSAKITTGGHNAADGTSVTFSLTGCVPTDATTPHFENGTCEMVRTTSAGVATAVIVSAVDGTYELVARVAGASAKLLVKFYHPVNPRTLAIYSVAPNRGRPEGGEQVLIRGRGFAAPLSVDFIVDNAARHANVVSVNAEGTQMVVVTPATGVDATEEQVADITVTAGSGTDGEVSDTLEASFTFEKQFSGPMIYSVVPPSGLVTGGETVVIYGANFFTPVKVTFGDEDVQVSSVAANGSTITLTTPQHSGEPGPVTVTVHTRYATAQEQQISRPEGFTWLPVTTDPDAPVVYQVIPNRGTPRGGETVVLIGANLCGLKDTITGNCIAAPEVSFQIGPPINATRDAEVVQFVPDGRTLTIITPEASPNPVTTDVPTTITVTNPSGSYDALNAFTYIGEARPPIIYYLDPDRGSARGGDTVTIYGRFFLPPVAVTFSPGGSAQVTEVAADGTYVRVITPAVTVPALEEDTLADVTVISEYGTGRDAQVTLDNAYLYIAEEPTPVIFSLTPNSGPIEGGTRVTIFGEGFQYPVQVLFGDRQAEVVSSNFNEVIVVSPSITVTEPNTPTTLQVTVRNMLTGKVSNAMPYRYGEAMFISAISPLEGPDIGGTIVTIFGQGFVAPVAVTIAGVEATVLSVAGTEIVVRTNPPGERSCSAQSGPVIVTNVNSNISATGPTFTYRPARPLIAEAEVMLLGVLQGDNIIDQHDDFGVVACQTTPPYSAYEVVVRGENFERFPNSALSAMTVIFENPPLEVTTTWISANEIRFQLPDLAAIEMDTAPCTSGGQEGVRDIPTGLAFTVLNNNNGCEDTLDPALIVNPCDPVCSVGTIQITLTPASLTLGVGTSAQMTACINAVQPIDTTVVISQSGPSNVIDFTYGIVTAPSLSITILAGAACETFDINGLNGGGPVAVTATLPISLGGGTATSQVNVGQIGITLTPESLNLPIGGTGNMTIQLSTPAPAGGADVTVTLTGGAGIVDLDWAGDGGDPPDDTSFTITIPQGSSSYGFTIEALSAGGPVTVTATVEPALGGASDSSTVFVGQYTVLLSPEDLVLSVGGVGQFTVSIDAPAPPGGLLVTISQTGAAGVISTPGAPVLIPGGAQQVNFNVTGLAAGGPIVVTATLPASVGGASDSSTVTVASYTVTISPTSLNLSVGQTGNFQVCLNTVAPAAILVTLTQTGVAGVIEINGAGAGDDSTTILAGNTCAPFTVLGLSQGGPITLTANLPAALNAPPATATVNVSTITLNAQPSAITIPLGGSATFVLNLSIPAPSGFDVITTNGTPGVATLTAPVGVDFTTGSTTSAPFTVAGTNLGTTILYMQLPPTLGGSVAQVTVNVVNALTITPSSLTIPVAGSGTYTLTIAAAQAANVNVDLLFSGSPTGAVTFPVNPVVIPAGSTTTTFDVLGAAAGSGTITATLPLTGLPTGLAGASASAGVTVTGSGISLTPTTLSIPVGGTGTFIINLANPAPTGGISVTLTSSNAGIATVGSPVVIPAGSTSSGPVTVNGLQQGTVTITAQLPATQGGGSATLGVTVTPFTLSVNPASVTVGPGGTAQVMLTMSPSSTAVTNLTINTLNAAVATAGAASFAAGTTTTPLVITGVAPGSTTITAALPANLGGAIVGINVTVQPYTVTVSPATLNLPVGGTATFTVSMSPTNAGAATAFTAVPANAAVATVSAPVAIPAGATTSAPLTVTGVGLGSTVVTVTLTVPGAPTAQVTVNVTGYTLTAIPSSLNVPVGGTNSFQIQITPPVPAGGGTSLSFASGNTNIATIPGGPIAVTAGATVAGPFAVTGVALGGTTIFVTSAGLGGASVQVPINVQQGLTIVPSALTVPVGGAGQFILNMTYAQAADVDVLIEWGGSGTGAISVTEPAGPTTYPDSPATVTIPAGQLTQTFIVNGLNATVTPFTLLATLPDTLPAGLAGAQANAQVTVTGEVSSATLTLTPSPVIWYLPDTDDPTLTIGITPTQGTATTITLGSTNPSVGLPANPTEDIPSGSPTVNFDVIGSAVGTTGITADLPPSISGAQATAQVTFFDLAFSPLVLNLAPGGNGNIVMSTTTSIPAPITVQLASDDTAVFTVPPTIVIPAGSSVAIPITVTGPGTANLDVTLPATSGGDTLTSVATINVSDVTVNLTPDPLTTYVGSQATMTATISAAQPTDTTVTLAAVAGTGSVTVPATATILAGNTSATFPVTGVTLGSATVQANLPASLNSGATPHDTASVTVADVPLSLTPAGPTTLYRGQTLVVTASIAPVVRTSDTLVTLGQAGAGSIVLPPTVTIPAGSTSATFDVTAGGANGNVNATGTLPAALTAVAAPQDTAAITVANLTMTLTPNPMNLYPSDVGVMTATIPVAYPADIILSLASTAPGVFTVPATATILAGATSTTFNVTALATAVPAPAGNVQANFPAGYTLAGTPHATAAVNVNNLPLTLAPGSTSIMAGGKQVYTVSIPVAQPTATIVTLASSTAAVSVPASVTIPAGNTSVTFDAIGETTTGSPSTIGATLPATLNAAAGPHATSSASVVPLTLSFSPTNVNMVAATDQLVTVTLGTTPAKPIAINLATNDPLIGALFDAAGAVGINHLDFAVGDNTEQFTIRGTGVGSTTVGGDTPAALGGLAGFEASSTVNVLAVQLQISPLNLTIAQGNYGMMGVLLTNVPGGAAVALTVDICANNALYSLCTATFAQVDPDGAGGVAPGNTAQIVIPAGTNAQTFWVYGFSTGGTSQIAARLNAVVGGGVAAANVGVFPSAPTVTSVTPTSGTVAGSPVAVAITGTNFGTPLTVEFGAGNFGTCNYVNANLITCTGFPAGTTAGPVNVTVNVPAGTATLPNGFTYTANLALTSVTSTNAPTGSFVTGPNGINCTEPGAGTCSAVQTASPALLTPTALGADTTWTWGGACGACAAGANCNVTMNVDPQNCSIVFN